MVCASTQNAMLSVLLAYIVPSVLIIAILTLLILAGISEILAATLSLTVTTVYFIVLYLLRNKFAEKIKFKVKIA
ncbi:MAG: SoxR reducing system RseC family protein [Butyricimonas faecihominis]